MKKDNRIVIEYTLDHEQITSPSDLTAAQKRGLQNTFQGHSRQLTSPCNIKDVHSKIFQARIEGILVNSGALDISQLHRSKVSSTFSSAHEPLDSNGFTKQGLSNTYRGHYRQLMNPWILAVHVESCHKNP